MCLLFMVSCLDSNKKTNLVNNDVVTLKDWSITSVKLDPEKLCFPILKSWLCGPPVSLRRVPSSHGNWSRCPLEGPQFWLGWRRLLFTSRPFCAVPSFLKHYWSQVCTWGLLILHFMQVFTFVYIRVYYWRWIFSADNALFRWILVELCSMNMARWAIWVNLM